MMVMRFLMLRSTFIRVVFVLGVLDARLRCTVCAVVVNIIFDDIQHKPSRQGRHHHNNVKLH